MFLDTQKHLIVQDFSPFSFSNAGIWNTQTVSNISVLFEDFFLLKTYVINKINN